MFGLAASAVGEAGRVSAVASAGFAMKAFGTARCFVRDGSRTLRIPNRTVSSTMMLNSASLGGLAGVQPGLVRIVTRAATASQVPFAVVEGVRTQERQKELLKAGATKILNSCHITGHAVDLVPVLDGKGSLQAEGRV